MEQIDRALIEQLKLSCFDWIKFEGPGARVFRFGEFSTYLHFRYTNFVQAAAVAAYRECVVEAFPHVVSTSRELSPVQMFAFFEAADAKGGVVVMPSVVGLAYHFRDPSDASAFQTRCA